MRTLGIYSLNNFHVLTHRSVNYICHVVHYIPSAYLSYNWKFVHFDCFHPNPPPNQPPPLVTTNLISFSMSLFICFWSITILCSWFTKQWFNISIHFKIIITIKSSYLPFVNLPRYYIIIDIFPILYISYLWLIYFVTGSLYLLISLTYFSSTPPLATISLFSVYMNLSVLLHFFICFVFLDSTCKWNYTVFVFLWLISLSIISSIHVVANGNISFSFMAE